jgi:hypothetical protein
MFPNICEASIGARSQPHLPFDWTGAEHGATRPIPRPDVAQLQEE